MQCYLRSFLSVLFKLPRVIGGVILIFIYIIRRIKVLFHYFVRNDVNNWQDYYGYNIFGIHKLQVAVLCQNGGGGNMQIVIGTYKGL
ncbi:hypothetical protein IX324_000506 [Bacteroides pyogenes]|nr:hypothetical protein [Bacteroides pyogenes]